jgi:hypothetical protein
MVVGFVKVAVTETLASFGEFDCVVGVCSAVWARSMLRMIATVKAITVLFLPNPYSLPDRYRFVFKQDITFMKENKVLKIRKCPFEQEKLHF